MLPNSARGNSIRIGFEIVIPQIMAVIMMVMVMSSLSFPLLLLLLLLLGPSTTRGEELE